VTAKQPNPSRWIWALSSRVVQVVSLLSFAAFGAGVAFEDRWLLTQWLSWIPAMAPFGLGLLALGLVLMVHRPGWRRRAVLQAVLVVLAASAILRNSVGWPREMSGVSAETVRVLQWNTNWPASDDPRSMQALAGAPADVVLISNRGSITSPDLVHRWAGRQARVVGAGPFALVTEWPVIEARMVAAGGSGSNAWYLARFVVLPPAWNGRPLRIAMVDLPSRPSLPRIDVANAMSDAIQKSGLGEVDVVAGDFNAISGSVILSRCFGGMHDAANEAGVGWYATWPRRFPLWQIDHTLLGPGLRCVRAWTIDPDISAHRMTMSILAPASEALK
jgi:endonuclease/exonuclease/phosphatase (EEP) superfamily protein YafD